MVQVVLRVSPTCRNRKGEFNRFHFLTLPHPHWKQHVMLLPMHLCPSGQAQEIQNPGGEATVACVRLLVFCLWSRMIQLKGQLTHMYVELQLSLRWWNPGTCTSMCLYTKGPVCVSGGQSYVVSAVLVTCLATSCHNRASEVVGESPREPSALCYVYICSILPYCTRCVYRIEPCMLLDYHRTSHCLVKKVMTYAVVL